MKKYILSTLILCSFVYAAQAQEFKWGLKVGIGTSSLRPENLDSTGTGGKFSLAIKDAKFGYYGGLFASVKLGPVILQPEALLNSNRVDYTFKDLKNPAKVDSVKTERYTQLDIPILLGTKIGPLRVKAGPVAHIHIGSKSDLASISGFKEQWKTALWGYQAGVGLNFTSHVHLDIRYEGNFDKWGSQISIGGKDYQFAQRPSRWLVNLGYAF